MTECTLNMSKSQAKALYNLLPDHFDNADIKTVHATLKDALEDKVNYGFTPESLIKFVCNLTGFTEEQIRGKRGSGELSDTRAVLSTLLHELFPNTSQVRIGRLLNRHRTTIIHHFGKTENKYNSQPLYFTIKEKIMTEPYKKYIETRVRIPDGREGELFCSACGFAEIYLDGQETPVYVLLDRVQILETQEA